MDNEQHSIRIVIAAGHEAFRRTLRSLLALDQRVEIVGEASDGAHAVSVMLEHKPDVLLLDLALPRMLDLQVSNLFVSHLPALRIVALVAVLEKTNILEAFRHGAHAVLVKTTAPKPLFRSIRSVMAGGYWLEGDGVGILVEALRDALGQRNGTPSPGDYGLTPRELDIVAKIIRGRSNKEVGEAFSISERTVKHHLTNIFHKLGVSSRLQLALFAVNHPLIFHPPALVLQSLQSDQAGGGPRKPISFLASATAPCPPVDPRSKSDWS